MLGEKLLIFQYETEFGTQLIGLPLACETRLVSLDIQKLVDTHLKQAGPFACEGHKHEPEVFIGRCIGGEPGNYSIEIADGSGRVLHGKRG